MVAGAQDEADALVAEGGEVAPALLDRDGVVAGDARKAEVFYGRVDQHDRDVARGEPPVVLVRGVGLGVQAAGEHHPGHLLLEEQVHVVGLGDAALGLRAQHGGESELGQRAADDLGERREDRVLQLGQDQADEPGALAAQLCGPLVAEDVERGEHRLPGGLRNPGLAVEHPADRGLADSDLPGHLSKSSRHARKNSASFANGLRTVRRRGGSRGAAPSTRAPASGASPRCRIRPGSTPPCPRTAAGRCRWGSRTAGPGRPPAR